jgi:hypothetical protein
VTSIALAASCGGRVANEGTDSGTTSGGSASGSGAGGPVGSASSSGSTTGSSGSGSSSGASGSGSTSSGGSGGPIDAGSVPDAACGATPTLHQTPPGTIYCGTFDAGALLCTTGRECCLGGLVGAGVFAPDECSTFGTACTNGAPDAGGTSGIPIHCNQVADCHVNGQGSTSCCLRGGALMSVPGCGYPKVSGGTDVVCEISAQLAGGVSPCGAGEVQVCSSQLDCPTGTTCTAGKWKIFQLGFCL